MYNQIYSISSEFVKSLKADKNYFFLIKNWSGKRGPKRRLSIEKVIALNLLRFFLHVKDLKAFHRIIRTTDMVPEMPNYENFLKATNKAFPAVALFMQVLLLQNRAENESGVHFIDSTPVSTCLNRRIFSHKVTSGLASRGKSSKGWFYGFKLHGVCSEKGVLESVVFTSGNINDSKMVEKVTENMKGWFYCDAGYLKKCGELVRLAESGRFICAAARRNMNRIVSNGQWRLLRKRNIIESDWGVLKQNFFLEYHQARSMHGIFRHYCFAISAYVLQCRLKSSLRLKTRI